MTRSRVLCSVALLASTQLPSWAQADDPVVSVEELIRSEEPGTISASSAGDYGLIEDPEDTREMSHHRRYSYPASYVLPSPVYYPRSHYYPRYLVNQKAFKEDDMQTVDDQEEMSPVAPPAGERDLSHRRHHSPAPYGYYYSPAEYYTPKHYVGSPYPRYLKEARRAAVVDKSAAAQSKFMAASRKVRNMGHRRYGYYHVPLPYYSSYYGYRNSPYGYVRYLY
ncbi:hypothetical protein TGARI_287250 [Toxoplasma gondii ARI]|uniref:Transmembrane protein n=3 Tax=Toxoplasma gondii TaxID=5811 RepID=A0A2G8XYN5_TOXGO|nr:hypothetical protein TGMAS_287250 [Toxoplasma gondii MAS]KYF43739.1 hypothetical protein TGARI_287250 [Toxoplasma gondii ARI]PIM00135.1 hypothetical protein TGCOUG_287250 [Toxoplasma gondii COUG]